VCALHALRMTRRRDVLFESRRGDEQHPSQCSAPLQCWTAHDVDPGCFVKAVDTAARRLYEMLTE
jgi:hypothetical protein